MAPGLKSGQALVALVLVLGLAQGCVRRTSVAGSEQPDASPHEVVPEDWMVVRLQKDGPQQVISRKEYQELRAKGIRPKMGRSMERKPPMLLDASTPLKVVVGQVKTFMFEDAPIEKIEISGGTAEAYWTRPYMIRRRQPTGGMSEHKGSDVHLKGFAPGTSTMEVEFSDGQPTRVIPIEVLPAKKGVG